MEATELRVGNIVQELQFDEGVVQFSHQVVVRGHDIELLEVNGYLDDARHFTGIPLTEELLLRLGFKEGNAVHSEGFSIDVQETDFYLRHCFHGGYYWGFNLKDKMDCELYDVLPLKYVHELQNLYYALTGKELSLQPKSIES